MSREPRRVLCETKAAEVLQRFKIDQLPVDPIAIAEHCGILVEAKPVQSKGVSGMLIRHGDEYAIAYATHIESSGFQRFSVAHELGHFFLPDHPEALFASGPIHQSRAQSFTGNPFEMEADYFAAALLMPKSLFIQSAKKHEKQAEGLDVVIGIASDCGTSLTSTAIRYTELTDLPVAIIVSSQSRVEYCFMSETMRSLPGLEWPKKKSALPYGTRTLELNLDREGILNNSRLNSTTCLSEWLGTSFEIEAEEDVMGLGDYGKTLTMLVAMDSVDPEELAEEQDMIQSWRPKFRR